MTILLDTNVIMDALQERSPFDIPAKEILLRGQNGELTCLLTANSAADIFYLYNKVRDIQSAKAALDFLLSVYKVVSVTHEDCITARSLPIDDFEDGLIVACAEKVAADYIITRDKCLLEADSVVRLIAPAAFIALLQD